MLQVLDAAALRQWCAVGLESLLAARQEIDDLNVYPVPDGDTGTNLHLTMVATVAAVGQAPGDLASTLRAMVTGSLMGARGNSGVILSQLLRGLSEVLAPLESVRAEDLKAGLVRSAESAYAAVAAPVEGTILTVAREAAAAACGPDLATLVRTAREAAADALARTPDLLPQLRLAGVVDAGGRGWCVLLEALEQVVTGRAPVPEPTLVVPRDRSGLAVAREAGSEAYGYEVQYLLRETSEEAVAALKQRLAPLGDSLVVVGGGDLFNVHVHVNDVGAAVEAGVEAGRPFRITVTRFADQVGSPVAAPQGRAVVAVASGRGLVRLFTEAGARVVDGGPTTNPSTAELLTAVRATGAAEVVLLPNDGNVRAVAEATARLAEAEGLSVVSVPTRSPVQGLAAVSVADRHLPLDADVDAMATASEETRWGEVTSAVRDGATEAGACREGDVLGLVGGTVVEVGSDPEAVARSLLARMLAEGGELATVVVGAPAAPGAAERLAVHLRERHPEVEVLVLDGGQPYAAFLLGIE